MEFALSWEQQQLVEACRGFLGELPSGRDLLEGRGQAEDPKVWQRIVEEQGWPAIAVPEEAGGFGFGWFELSLIFTELGRSLTACPMLGTAFATAALVEGQGTGDSLEALASGTVGAFIGSGIEATRDGEGWALSGAANVIDGGMAELFVLATAAGFFILSADQISRAPLPGLDVTRPLVLVNVGVTVGDEVRFDADAGKVAARCEALLAAEAVGAAEACLDLAVDYAKVRVQFGKPIGAFQSIQHKCADMLVALESARSAAWYAAWSVDSGAPDSRLACRAARSLAGDALRLCAGENIQIHGGIGFTWEHDAHLYFKRHRSMLAVLGSPADHRAAIAEALLDA